MEIHDIVQQTRIKTTDKKKKCKKAKCLSGERLTHFEFSFAYGDRKGCDFILLQLVDHFVPAPLVKEIVFSSLYILVSFVKDKVSIGAWIYLWAFNFVPLIYISVFVPVPYCLDDCGFVV